MAEPNPEPVQGNGGESTPQTSSQTGAARRARVMVPGARGEAAGQAPESQEEGEESGPEQAAESADPESPEWRQESGGAVAPPSSTATPSESSTVSAGEDWQAFSGTEAEELRERWRRLQGDFVDDPRGSVAAADALVEEVLTTLTRRLDERRRSLGGQWADDEEGDTERLRLTVRDYRTVLQRMLDTAG